MTASTAAKSPSAAITPCRAKTAERCHEDEVIDERVRRLEEQIERPSGPRWKAGEPDYTAPSPIALSYDLIFRESKITQRVSESLGQLEDVQGANNQPTANAARISAPGTSSTRRNGAKQNGHFARA
jgi:hypothetical protein